MMRRLARGAFVGLGVAGALMLSQGALAKDVNAQRAELRKMCDQALAVVYKAKPEVKDAVAKSAGYGCFTSFGMSFFIGGAGGSGLVHSNATKKDVYMKMGQASGGVDFGIQDYREVLVFKDAKTLEQFVNKGWEMSGGATAVATADGKGGQTSEQAMAASAIQVYPISKNGLAIGVAAAARKYWKDDELNAAK